MDALKILSKYHDEWLNIVRLFGDSEFAQDVVQDVYLKVHSNYRERIIQNGEPNRALMWVLLRNTAFRASRNHNDLSIDLFYSLPQDDFELSKHESLDLIYHKVEDEIKTWEWYDQMLFNIYRKENKSMRQIAEQTGISLKSIFTTIKTCKAKLRQSVGDDYTDYLNQEFELI